MVTRDEHADGVLPDEVVRSPFAHGVLAFVVLRDDLDATSVQQFLTGLTALQHDLTAEIDGHTLATMAVGFSSTFFATAAGPRFGLDGAQVPHELATTPNLAGAPIVACDLVIYFMSTAEAVVAQFELGFSALRAAVKSVHLERGFQRATRRELGGFLDGLRNISGDQREDFVFIDGDDQPEEPIWCDGGTYMAYMKIRQDLDLWNTLTKDQQESAIGRRKDDGSRLDLPAGTTVDTEADFADPANPPLGAHVRKVGPRGELHDQTRIFRRGLPFVDLADDASVNAGLQFVSFQKSFDQFDTIFNRWMNNPAFLNAGVGPDALVAQHILQFLQGAFFFVPPHDDRFIGAGMFDAVLDRCKHGRIIVHKHVLDANQQPVLAELGGITFQVFDANNQAVGAPFSTNSQGRAMSPDLPIGAPLVLRETQPPPNFTPAADVSITLDCRRTRVDITNTATSPGSGYGG